MTSDQISGKRLDSLARNRASAALKELNPEKWRELYQQELAMLRAERAILGTEVPRTRRPPVTHMAGEDGKCVRCGKAVPCPQMRKREREKALRKQSQIPQEYDESA